MPPFFPNDFVSPSTAVALVGAALYGDEWNGCPTLSEVSSLYNAIASLRNERTLARQRELWPALSASSRLMRRRAHQLELGAERAAKMFVSLGDSDKKAIDDEIEAKFAEGLARERRSWNAKTRLLELLCSAQVTTTLLASNGKTYEMQCEFWASDQAGSAVDSGEASYNLAIYDKSEPFKILQGGVLVPKADLIVVLEGAPDGGAARSDAMDVDTSGPDQTDAGIDVTRGNTQEAEPDSSDDAGNQKSKPAKSRRGNPAFTRGPYYEPLETCLRSQAKILEKKERSLSVWLEELSRKDFYDLVGPALGEIKLPSARTLYNAGRQIVTEIEKR